MRVAEFDFCLPEELVALRPVVPRDRARLLIVREGEHEFEEAIIADLPNYLRAGDVMVSNDTRVIPARLTGTRPARGKSVDASIEVTLHKRLGPSQWAAFAKPGRKLVEGDMLRFSPDLSAKVLAKSDGGEIRLDFNVASALLDAAIAKAGVTPLPPYIASKRSPDMRDATDYQTIFAARDGAVAAPTAGLHFTDDLLKAIDAKGVLRETVTLHVGAGTFLPVKAEDTKDHIMHAEWGEVQPSTAAHIRAAVSRNNRVLCVGTTSLRTIEAASRPLIAPFSGDIDLFITPGFEFRTVNMLLTNFHLPKSTLFMLVSAFCGLSTMRTAYRYAIDKGFRFYSYGDACLLLRKAS